MPNCRGFTLLEICLAVFIAVLIALIAVPSIQGVVDERNSRRSFDAFEALVRDAQSRSVTEHRAYVIEWERDGLAVRPQEPKDKEEAKGVSRLDFREKQMLDLQLPAALMKNPAKQWTFWPTGTCEPAIITARDDAGRWTASYDPLTVRAMFSTQ